MTDYTAIIVAMSQTIVLLYVAAKLNKIHRMMERLTTALVHMAGDLDQAIKDMQTLQDDISDLEDLLRSALRE